MRAWMKEKRVKLNLTQQYVAKKLGITKQYYQQIECGQRQKDLATTLVMGLAACFKMSPVEIANKEMENEKDHQ